jgi:hypothetical protein
MLSGSNGLGRESAIGNRETANVKRERRRSILKLALVGNRESLPAVALAKAGAIRLRQGFGRASPKALPAARELVGNKTALAKLAIPVNSSTR